jgi:hypothetical protein
MQRQHITTMKPLITTIMAIMTKPNDMQPQLPSTANMHTGTPVKLINFPTSEALID